MIINSQTEIELGSRYLIEVEPRFSEALQITGPLPLRRRAEGFAALLDMIVSQQVSVAAAESIWLRLKNAGYIEAEALLNCRDEELRECGLSRQKVSYVKALATANLDYFALRDYSDEVLISCLTKIRGIGRWTAEIYGIFSLGRSDMFSAGDLALQESTKTLFELAQRPTEKELRLIAEPWRPWRAVAARLLWSYYREVKNREGIR